MKILISFCFGVLLCNNVFSQVVERVTDFFDDSNGWIMSSAVEFKGKLYFSAGGRRSGIELWEYDGIKKPKMVEDIHTGLYKGSYPRDLVVLNEKLYFVADNGVTGYSIWEYDGVNAPKLSYDLDTRPQYDGVGGILCVHNGFIYLDGNDKNSNTGLWRYDGVNDPEFLKELEIGASVNVRRKAIVFNDKIYFSANDGVSGWELWEYDGVNSPKITYDINRTTYDPSIGHLGSYPEHLTVFNNKLYFTADPDNKGSDTWEYDGINSPKAIKYVINRQGQRASTSSEFSIFNNKLYLHHSSGSIYRYDGEGKTQRVYLTSYGTGTFFVYHGEPYLTSASNTTGIELFKFDSLARSIDLIEDIYVGTNSSRPANFIQYKNSLYFSAIDENHGVQMWKFTTDIPVAINDVTISRSDLSYPNPMRNVLNVSDNISVVEIRDMKGAVLIRENNNKNKINVSHLSRGVYLVKYELKSGEFRYERLVKE